MVWYKVGLCGIIIGLLTACQMALPLPETAGPKPLGKLPDTTEQRRLAFAGGMFDLKRGDLYAAYPYWHYSLPNVNVGLFVCNASFKYRLTRSQAYWNEDDNIFGKWPDEAGLGIEAALAEQGYQIKRHRQSFFTDLQNKPRAELLLSMRVVDMKMNLCHINMPMIAMDMGRSAGNGVITVEWEIFDTIREKSLGTFTTRGYGHVDEPLSDGIKAVFLDAVHQAAIHLGNLPDFRRLITTANPIDLIPKTVYQPLNLTTRERTRFEPIRYHLTFARRAVLVVRAEQGRVATGFYINNDGYALTTAQAIGDSEAVQITDSGGTKYNARVIRKDDRRNVALIKADVRDNPALPIVSDKRPDAGAPVFAIGTPFSNSYRATLTQGIISYHRYQVHRGLDFIQATIPTTDGFAGGPLTDEFGNVIGLTDSTLSNGDESNFGLFIPISSVLETLNIQILPEGFKPSRTPEQEPTAHQ